MTQSLRSPRQRWWCSDGSGLFSGEEALKEAISSIARPVSIVQQHGRYAVSNGGQAILGASAPTPDALPLHGYAPECSLTHLGDPDFCAEHNLRYPYVAGAMAKGITSADIVEEMGRYGMVGFFGAGGLSLSKIEAAIERISSQPGTQPYGCNLLYSPQEPQWEHAVVDLYIKRGVKLVSAAAYLQLTLPLVRYRVTGIYRDAEGRVVTPNRIMAKVSRVEVARQFFAPPPERFLRQLVSSGEISAEQAKLAESIPMAQDLTAEADSGGHTDNRPALTLVPAMLALRDQMQTRYRYAHPLRVGAAGGIATPASAAAAFAMGAAYVLTGSINQACQESGASDTVRTMLAEARQADVTMAPAADMFEMGVKVQVLKRGTMFAMRAGKLYDLYRQYDALDALPAADREMLEKKFLRSSLDVAWQQTRRFFLERDPAQIERADRDPKYKMALVFRSYLGQATNWANCGDPSRKVDYQIWCGPAIGSFNEWAAGSFLAAPDNRRVVTVALNILYGAAVIQRLNFLRMQGLHLPPSFWNLAPLPSDELQRRLAR